MYPLFFLFALVANWFRAINFFETLTKRNQHLMLLLSTDHTDKLRRYGQTDARILAFYESLLPFYKKFTTAYDQRLAKSAVYQSQTLYFQNKIKELRSVKVKQWEAMIMIQYADNEVIQTALFPRGRTAFYKGSYDSMLRELSALHITSQTFPELEILQTDVGIFLEDFQKARNNQQGTEGDLAQARKEVEFQRMALATEMFRVYGNLVSLHAEEPAILETYYEVKYFRKANANNASSNAEEENDNIVVLLTESGNIVAQEHVGLFSKNINAETHLLIENRGKVPLQIWTDDNFRGSIPNDAPILQVGKTQSFIAKSLLQREEAEAKILFIGNPTSEEGQYTASVIKHTDLEDVIDA